MSEQEKTTAKEPETMSLPELIELLHLVADEIELRMMQQAGDEE